MRVLLFALSVLMAGAAFDPAAAQRSPEAERFEERPRDRELRREERRRESLDEEPRRGRDRQLDEDEGPRRGRDRAGDDNEEADERRGGGRLIRSHPRMGSRCVDIEAEVIRPGARVHMWDCHGRRNQRFSLNGDELTVGGLCLEPAGLGRQGDRVTLARCDGERQQSWSVDRARRGFVQIVSSRGFCLDILSFNPANGAALIVHECHGQQNQLFEVE